MEKDRVRPPGRRIIELAINDAIQSRLCLNSPIKAQMERDKRERRRNISKITVWAENGCPSARVASDVHDHERMRGRSRPDSLQSTWNRHSNEGLYSVKNQNSYLSSTRPAFSDPRKNEFFNRCTKTYYTPSISLNSNSSKSRSKDAPYCSTTQTAITASENSCNEKPNSAYRLNKVEEHPTNSQQIYPSYDCADRNVNVQSDPQANLSTIYDLPILSDPSKRDWLNSSHAASESSNEKNESEIPKLGSDLLNHLNLHSLEDTLKCEESPSGFIQPPKNEGHWLNVGEQNPQEVEIPAPLDLVDDAYSLPIIPPKEQALGFYGCSINNDKVIVQRCQSSDRHSSVKNCHSKSNPHISTLRHFEDLVLDHPEPYSPLVTVCTDNLELKIVSSNSRFQNYDTEYPILKLNERANLPDNLNAESVYGDETSVPFNFMKPFDSLHSIQADHTIFEPEVCKISNSVSKYNHDKNDMGKSIESFPSCNNILQHFPDYNTPRLSTEVDTSVFNPCMTNLADKDKLTDSEKLAFEHSSDTWKSSNQSFGSQALNSTGSTGNSLNPDIFLDSVNSNLQVTRFYASNSGLNETNTLNFSNCCVKNSKYSSSVEMFSSFDNSSDFYNNSVSDKERAFELHSLHKVSNSLDSGIGLTSEDWEFDSTWNLRSPSKSLNVSSSIQDEMDKPSNSKTTGSRCETDNLTNSQIAKDILSTTKLKFSLIPFNEYERARIEDLIEKFTAK